MSIRFRLPALREPGKINVRIALYAFVTLSETTWSRRAVFGQFVNFLFHFFLAKSGAKAKVIRRGGPPFDRPRTADPDRKATASFPRRNQLKRLLPACCTTLTALLFYGLDFSLERTSAT
ncbi:hypothetical protein LL912_01145 [Niabella sp. CC-SYL272]|uniref:hypothetical protein n=1 Tax=Niabella agricola TaxID=2891571 RepID=UPI001F221C3D|nr:hypothetical protein [Niabella agricola]MCF3107374.1 hypothetical protein [Niabella agricola]